MRSVPFARGLAVAASCALILGGCSGGMRAVPAQRPASTAVRATVGFTIRWPDRGVRGVRRPAFISPSALGVVVEVNPDAQPAGPVTFANNPQTAGGTSTLAIDAPVGADVFVISLYDQPQGAGETAAVGNELGRVTVAQTIAANATNALSATVIGTVAGVRIGPLPNQPNVVPIAGASPAAYELVGRAPATFAAAPLDADGNVIVQPDAPPAISLAPNGRAVGIVSVTPLAGTANEFTVQAVAPNTTTYPTALVATAADANGGTVTSSTIVDVTSAVYVAYANGGTPAVARFDARGAVLPLPAGAFAGLTNPVALAYDATDRAIFVADAGLGAVRAFDENGAPLAGFTPVAVAGANGVVYDPHNGAVYASGSAGITAFAPTTGGAPPGTVPAQTAATNTQGIAYVGASASGALNQVAIGNASATPRLAMFSEKGAPQGTPALAAAPLALAYGAPVAAGQVPQTQAQLYVTSASGIAALDAFGGPIATTADSGGPFGIAVDPNTREPLVAERGANALTAYLDDLSAVDATHAFATPASLGLTQPQGVCHVF